MYDGLTYPEIRYDDSLITPGVQPMTVAYAKKHIKSFVNAEDVLVASWIRAAASVFSEETGRPITIETRERWLDRFPCQTTATGQPRRIELPGPPLQSVVSVTYIDADGTLRAFSDEASPETLYYQVKAPQGTYATRGWIEPIYGMTWPIAREESGAVRIQYTCGYCDTSDTVPEAIDGILCLLVGNFDQFRAATSANTNSTVPVEVPLGIRLLMDRFKYSAFPREAPLR